uniref:Uncharacterized protein n=1 Tax=Setaria italica TaxID=4555 RepID=K4ANS3_SETIT
MFSISIPVARSSCKFVLRVYSLENINSHSLLHSYHSHLGHSNSSCFCMLLNAVSN